MKLCILGGGGFRTPYVYQALLRDTGTPRVDEVALYDVDERRLAAMVAILTELAAGFEDAPRLVPTTVLQDAVAGSQYVFAALRVGGLEGRRCDEHVALDLDVLGQETTGPGGLAYAIRTVPVMVEAARVIADLAPDAYVMNFTNPAGIITEAMQTVLGDRVLGICDTPSGLGRRVAGTLGLDHTRVQMDYVGLNHLGWMRRVLYDGRDVLPELLADDARLAAMEEGHVFGLDWIRSLGAIPNEYLFYYYFNRDAVRTIIDSGKTRGDFLAESQGAFYDRATAAGNGVADLWRETVARRSASYMAEAKGGTQDEPVDPKERETDPAHQGYAGVALGVMAAISRNERQTMILNVRNRGTIQGLPDDAVVEVPTMVDANGVHPLTTEQPDLHQIGLMAQVKDVERHTIAAGLTGSRSEALQAFALHPLVDSVTVARSLLDGYVARIPEVAAVLTH
ncbi:6-phospho-beta-glucosidase [Curtobacterium sp. MCBD17_034]|uniref:6-phospho-beta-glucosidase n=1 Tax=unclassified Curtobacterium TaxID=257496 RepID=UPI000DA807C9|nr:MULTISPECIES: 6-phospho-beta-glucosidase [unclassified Curtobacterium]PZE77740.1 6-phospho-beta-glucosidase [Curtobacterium sp. MCBD17_019]PZF62051.1 6-phospho-beta-glucosidase [Curtobacterium sp. MCBD17_034]PZF63036.1 6-phospho-beta-glucosidase [Curtobacterium sp. MCBD17_013]PZM34016.1 6-phospho-beta-glucosidase [Curtobacterium sp. MCBD17_031]WIB63676.1 6-phospho-beta-glucosidase [Curtobacterium sp. MCBD17_040]